MITEEEEEYITICRNHQESIIDKIIFLQGQDYFNNYRHEEVSLDEALQKHIQETMYMLPNYTDFHHGRTSGF